jgi:hypothetical protein
VVGSVFSILLSPAPDIEASSRGALWPPAPPRPHANGAARGMVKLITLCVVGVAALAIVGGAVIVLPVLTSRRPHGSADGRSRLFRPL